MRPRALMHAALPMVGLAALAVIGGLRPTTAAPLPTTLTSQGSGSISPVVVVRIVTDGRPQLVTLPADHPSLVIPATPVRRVVLQRVTVVVTRSAPRAVAAPAPVRSTAPRPAPPAVQQQSTTSDTYPYAYDTSNSLDPWGFTKRQCVSYVAWRLADVGRAIDNSQGWGSALTWDDTARKLGYTVSSRASVGAVAQWNAHESSTFYSGASTGTFVAGSMGHVAWVTKVYSDGSVLVAQYNGSGDRSFSTMHVRAPRFLSL